MINKDLFNKFRYDGWAVQVCMEWQHNEFLKYCKEQELDIRCKYVEERPWKSPDIYFVYSPLPDWGLHKFNGERLKEYAIPEIIKYCELIEDRLSVEDFWKQDGYVQSLILQNHKESPKDLIQVVDHRPKETTLEIKKQKDINWRVDRTLPLLTAEQLEKVIEKLTGVKINTLLEDGKYVIYILDKKYKTNTDNLLQAYLQVINQLASKYPMSEEEQKEQEKWNRCRKALNKYRSGKEKLTLNDLEDCFKFAKELNEKFVGIKIQMQGFEKPELIINQKENFDTKLEYYKKAYNEDLTLKAFNGIKIIGFTYGNEFQDIEKDLIKKEKEV